MKEEPSTATTGAPGNPLRDHGARFLRVALHVNPYPYLARNAVGSRFTDEVAYNRAIVAACQAAGVEAVALTDHFEIMTSASLRAAAEQAGLHVFPGFEAQTSDGVHVLVLFDPGTPNEKIMQAIGASKDYKDQSSSPRGCVDVVKLVQMAREEWRAVTIAAHVTSPGKGILTAIKGQARVAAWRAPDLLAVAIPGSPAELAEGERSIVLNENVEYRRQRPVAVINARDVDGPDDVAHPASTTYVKMSEVTVEGLRQAFLDPVSRVRLNSDPVPERHTQFLAIEWAGGFLGGTSVGLNENLNVLIGGRGAGKSCVIESLRYVLEHEPIGPEARELHAAIVHHVLRAGTKVTLRLRVHGAVARDYEIERTVDNPAVVRDEAGTVMSIRPRDLVRGIEIYGQHEISELTKSADLLTRLLDRFVSLDETVSDRRLEVERLVRTNRARVVRAREQLSAIDDKLLKLPALEDRLRSFEGAGLEEKFKERSGLVPEEPLVGGLATRPANARSAVDSMRTAARAALRPTLTTEQRTALPHADLIDQAEQVLAEVATAIADAADAAEAAITNGETRLAPLVESWRADHAEVDERYQEILRTVQAEKVNAQTFIALRQQIEQLRQVSGERDREAEELASALEARRGLLAELEDLRASELRALSDAADRVSHALSGIVRVRIAGGQQRSAVGTHLREHMRGTLKPIIEHFEALPSLSVRELAATIAEGAEALRQRYGLTPAQAALLVKLDEDPRLELEEIELRPLTLIDLNVRPGASAQQWQPLRELSTGQKATAILLLLLLEADTPLVIDQPEDDLDNRFISEQIVGKIKEEKRRRQFIFSSHNANVPVLGDAELIIGLRATADRATIPEEYLGSIDRASIRDLASSVLEGGRDAFEFRRQKYDF